jgi:hypothetical protein
MTTRDFCFWLLGYMSHSDDQCVSDMDDTQVKCVMDKLKSALKAAPDGDSEGAAA